jgi:hypothetical protein
MKLKKISIVILLLAFCSLVFAQKSDSTKKQVQNYNIKKPGGIFIAPVIGAEFPTKGFNANSKYTISLGGRLEYASTSIYPFIIGATIQYQNHNGSDDFKTLYLINSLSTKITSYGISVDMILNKFLKSSFTIPFVFLEARSLSVKREVSPASNYPDLKSTDNTIAFGGGGGFTLYIFDIYASYLSAKEYSTISIKARFRFPLIKF